MPQPDSQYLDMAAAMMHREGRLIEQDYSGMRKSDNIEDRRTTTDVEETSGFRSDIEELKKGGDRLEEMKPSKGGPTS